MSFIFSPKHGLLVHGFDHQQVRLLSYDECDSYKESNKKRVKEEGEKERNETQYPHSKKNSKILCYF